ncbi:MAG: hypothetical protein MHM6MM_008170, partial [Cercozoa sp. M6MM]
MRRRRSRSEPVLRHPNRATADEEVFGRMFGVRKRIWTILLVSLASLALSLSILLSEQRHRDRLHELLSPLKQHWRLLSELDLDVDWDDWMRSILPSETTEEDEQLELLRPGRRLAEQGVDVRRPVLMVPGVITTSLELWHGDECLGSDQSDTRGRPRIWGSLSMLRYALFDSECWTQHMMLDSTTGRDPSISADGKKKIVLRPATNGWDASADFVPGFWVWRKLIDNLVDLGFDSDTLSLLGYDWRRPLPLLAEPGDY